jgi:hypothetical protein
MTCRPKGSRHGIASICGCGNRRVSARSTKYPRSMASRRCCPQEHTAPSHGYGDTTARGRLSMPSAHVSPRMGPCPTLCEMCACAAGGDFHPCPVRTGPSCLRRRRAGGQGARIRNGERAEAALDGMPKREIGTRQGQPTAARPLGGGGAPSTDSSLQPYP